MRNRMSQMRLSRLASHLLLAGHRCTAWRFALALGVIFALVVPLVRPNAAGAPIATALVTDLMPLPLSNQFTAPNQFGLTGAGDVFFVAGSFALFRWDSSSGNRARLLQASDPHPGFPGSVMDIVGGSLRVNTTGHAAMVNNFIQKGARNPRGVFLFNGTSFQKVAMRGEVAPDTGGQVFLNFGPLRISDNDQIAFVATFEPAVLGTSGVFLGSPTGPPAKIATIGEVAPGTGGGTYTSFQLIGLNNAGKVAFLSDIAGGSTSRAVFVGDTAGVSKVVAQGESATGTSGTFNLVVLNPFNYALNASGDVAFAANVAGGGSTSQGIWIGNGSGAPAKLMVNTDPTGTTLGGNFGLNVFLHGFNDSGKVLFRSNPGGGATSNHALFLQDLSSTAQVIFACNQAAPGGTTETFFNTLQASLNDNDDVAFLAQLQGGAFPFGWFHRGNTTGLVKIAFQGDSTPVGGTFGLAGENFGAALNSSGQVAFFADVLGPNAIGAFLYTPGSGIASIVNTNDALPAGANTIIRTFMPGASDEQLLFVASRAGGRTAVFTKPLHPGDGNITCIFGEGDAAPIIGGALFFVFNFGQIGNNDEVAMAATVIGGSPYPADILFTQKPGVGLQKVVATGDPAPGPAGGTFANFDIASFSRPPARINSSGQVVFVANIAGSAGNASRGGIFIGSTGGPIQVVARMADPSPVGGTFANFNFGAPNPSLNDASQVAFRAVSQVGSTQTTALFVGSAAAPPVKVVKQGDSEPGGSTVNVIPTRFQMNNAGQVAYVAGLTGGFSPKGIFRGTAGGLQKVVALVTDAASGTGGGTFSDFRDPDIELNNAGQVAFWAGVTGSAVTSGYFLGSATAPPAARLVEGQPLPGGGVSGIVTPGLNNFIGENFTLADSGEMSMVVGNIAGAPNLFRQVIANGAGVLREFITPNDKAQGTGSVFGAGFQSTAVNSKGRFFDTAILVGGPSKWGIFTDK